MTAALAQKFLTAPNQHRPLPDLRREPGNIGPSPLPAVSSHIHSKTACRGASACQWHASYEPTGAERRPSPSAPAKNGEVSTMLASLFFVSAHKDSATRHGCALRSACRGVSERQWRSAANRSQLPLRSVLGAPHWGAAPEAAAETSSSHEFLLAFRSFLSVRTCSQPFPSPPAPKTHPVSPFSGFSGCVSLFLSSFDLQNFRAGFCASCRIVVTG